MDFILIKLSQQVEDAKNSGSDEELEFAEAVLGLYRKGLIDVSVSAETGELLYTVLE